MYLVHKSEYEHATSVSTVVFILFTIKCHIDKLYSYSYHHIVHRTGANILYLHLLDTYFIRSKQAIAVQCNTQRHRQARVSCALVQEGQFYVRYHIEVLKCVRAYTQAHITYILFL